MEGRFVALQHPKDQIVGGPIQRADFDQAADAIAFAREKGWEAWRLTRFGRILVWTSDKDRPSEQRGQQGIAIVGLSEIEPKVLTFDEALEALPDAVRGTALMVGLELSYANGELRKQKKYVRQYAESLLRRCDDDVIASYDRDPMPAYEKALSDFRLVLKMFNAALVSRLNRDEIDALVQVIVNEK